MGPCSATPAEAMALSGAVFAHTSRLYEADGEAACGADVEADGEADGEANGVSGDGEAGGVRAEAIDTSEAYRRAYNELWE